MKDHQECNRAENNSYKANKKPKIQHEETHAGSNTSPNLEINLHKDSEIYNLPPEVMLMPFSYLNEKELATARLVCYQWNHIANDLVTRKIRTHFPYLELTRSEDFQKNPHALYHEECARYEDIKNKTWGYFKWEFSTQLLFESLSGNLSHHSCETLKPNAKITLYSLAVSNGHYHFLKQFEQFEGNFDVNNVVNTAFKIAVQNGHLKVVQEIIERMCQEDICNKKIKTTAKEEAKELFPEFNNLQPVDSEYYLDCITASRRTNVYKIDRAGEELITASRNGFLSIVQSLLANREILQITDSDIHEAFAYAVPNNHFDVADCLLECIKEDTLTIYSTDITFEEIAIKGNLLALQYILKKDLGEKLLSVGIPRAFYQAAYAGKLPIIQYLLKEQNKLITSEDEGDALKAAAYHGHDLVVQYLLENAKRITSEHKMQASANTCGHIVIANTILQHMKLERPSKNESTRRCIMM